MAVLKSYFLQMFNGMYNEEAVKAVEVYIDKNLSNAKWVKEHLEERDGGIIRILFRVSQSDLGWTLTVADRDELIERYTKAGWYIQINNSIDPDWMLFTLADRPTRLSSEGG